MLTVAALTPLLALTNSLLLAAAAGLLTGIIMVLVTLLVSLSCSLVAAQQRWLVAGLIAAVVTGISGRLLSVYFLDLYEQLGIYLAVLVAVPATSILAAEFALKSGPRVACVTSMRSAVMLFGLFCVFGIVRELLAHGGLLMDSAVLMGTDVSLRVASGLPLLSETAGALMIAGLLLAAVQATRTRSE